MLKNPSKVLSFINKVEAEDSKQQSVLIKYNYMNYLEYVNVGYVLLNEDKTVISENKIILNYVPNNRLTINNIMQNSTFNFSKISNSLRHDKSNSFLEESACNGSLFNSSETKEFKVGMLLEEMFNNLIEVDEYFQSELNIHNESNNFISSELNSESSSKMNRKNRKKISEIIESIKHKLKDEHFFTIGVTKILHQKRFTFLELKIRMIRNESKDIFYEFLTEDVTKIIDAKIIRTQMIYKSMGLAKVAHDFKNPILSIISLLSSETNDTSDSYISSADEDSIDEDKSTESLTKLRKISTVYGEFSNNDKDSIIKNFCSYMMMLMEDFNIYAKMDLEKIIESPITIIDRISSDEVEIRPILEFSVNIFKIRQLNEKDKQKIDIRLVVDNDVPKKINVNETKLKQVLVNIISNSYKFTISGEIVVTAKVYFDEEYRKFFRIKIQDTGVGIKKEDQSKLFTPFKMIDNSKKLNQHGSGLGLLIIKEILNKMNSTIHFISEFGKGTTFWFDIPINGAINFFCKKKTFQELESTSFIDQNMVITESLANVFKRLNSDLKYSDLCELHDYKTIAPKNKLDVRYNVKNENCEQTSQRIPDNKTDECKLVQKSERISKLTPSNKSKLKDYISRKETLLSSRKEFLSENSYRKNTIRFMICDDEEIPKVAVNKLIISICEEKQIEYDISMAKNGIECLYILHLKQLKNEPIDILLIDDQMTAMSGSQTIRIIKELIEEKQMPDILKYIVTSNNDEKTKKTFLQNGVDEVISKPITKDKISQIISNKK